ncbi:MAG: UrcA family protein [Alphaproteobacteria bacterium]|nr:UrcA family protein [Alphaproteobacteria bacterium]
MNRSIVALCAAGTVALMALPATAENVIQRHVTVATADLALGTPQGDAQFDARIAQAAKQACGGNPHFDTHYKMAPRFVEREHDKCYAGAVNNAHSVVRMRRAAP